VGVPAGNPAKAAARYAEGDGHPAGGIRRLLAPSVQVFTRRSSTARTATPGQPGLVLPLLQILQRVPPFTPYQSGTRARCPAPYRALRHVRPKLLDRLRKAYPRHTVEHNQGRFLIPMII